LFNKLLIFNNGIPFFSSLKTDLAQGVAINAKTKSVLSDEKNAKYIK
jgi:hypothetical protein